MTIPELEALITVPVVAIIFVIRVRTGHPPRWLHQSRLARDRSSHPRSIQRWVLTPTTQAVISAVVVGALPWPVYLIARAHVSTSAQALLIATGIPLLWALVRCVRRRRLDAASLTVVLAYAAAVGLSLLFGNAALPLKLRDVAALAAVALACLISAATGHPLLLTGLRIITGRAENDHEDMLRARLADPAFRRDLSAGTVLAGTLFLLAAAIDVLLIAAVSTSTFLAIAGPLGGATPLVAITTTSRRSQPRTGPTAQQRSRLRSPFSLAQLR